MHNEAMLKLASKSDMSVSAQLSSAHATNQRHHRSMLMKLLHCIQYLARQSLAFRGHTEDAVYQLLLLQSKEHQEMRSWLQKREYISPEIVNEIKSWARLCLENY